LFIYTSLKVYSRVPISADSVSAVYRGPKKIGLLTFIRSRGRQIAALFEKKARISYLMLALGGRGGSIL
jgi:hypothetical protein